MFHSIGYKAVGELKLAPHLEKLRERSLPEYIGEDWSAESCCSMYWEEYFLQFWRGPCLLSEGWVGEILLLPRGLSSGLERTEQA